VINIALDTSKWGATRSLYSDVLHIAQRIGFQYKSEITWRLPIFTSTAFGSWSSACASRIISTVERMMILYKHQWQKQHKLIKLLSYKDDLVLDPFGGRGSVGVVAKQLGRPFILIEQSAQYCEAAKERLEHVA
jgi:site-specific DNA-methyltransferase (adenine-specific)